MATKRKYVGCDDDDDDNKMQEMHISNKKHTLDSDEEDSDEYEKEDLHDSDVEAEEDGISNIQDEVKITPFNMREELQEGHFDTEGHYHWNKGDDIKDNWLDNIDWIKVKTDKNYLKGEIDKDKGDTSEALPAAFNEITTYTELLTYMQKNETISQTIQRFGKGRKKLSSVDRIKQKKLGIVDEASEKITKITELANEILTNTGNMDIYQMTYEEIQKKIATNPSGSNQTNANVEMDMYADDFNEKEKKQLHEQTVEQPSKEVLWEFKWKQDDDVLNGPFTTKQMLQWSKDGHFKTGVYCRKVNETTNFYSSNRIDFDLYI